MAEAVGVVASVVGIAAFGQQLAASILKMKRFCEDVKDAPEELRVTLDRIENISNIMTRLGYLEQTSQTTEVDDIFQASIHLCQSAVGRISALAQELEDELRRKRLSGSMRAVLKKKTLEKLLISLERNKADLLIAQSMYADVRKSRELERLHKCVEEMRYGQLQMIEYTRTLSSQRQECAEEHQLCRQTRHATPRKGSDRSRKIRVRLPLWLCHYAWDLAFERAGGCSNISLRPFRIVTRFDPFMSAVNGNIKHVQQMLEARQLSIHDQNEQGDTLAMVAARYGQTELVKYLIEHGAEATWKHSMYLSFFPGYWPRRLFHPACRSSYLQVREHAQLLLDEFDIIDGHYEAIEMQALSKTPALLTYEERLLVLQHVGRGPYDEDWDRFCEILCVDNIEPELFHTKAPDGTTLLHILASFTGSMNNDSKRLVWYDIVLQAARAGADFNALDDWQRTPFTTLLSDRPVGDTSLMDRLARAVRMWLNCLAYAGVDLEDYGVAEQKHKRQMDIRWVFGCRPERWTILGFNHGPNPSDWRLWWRYPGDLLAGMLWSLVEDPELIVPGSWIEDDWRSMFHLANSLHKSQRFSGIKRRCLRKLRSESKRNTQHGTRRPDAIGLLDKLVDAVNLNAESWKLDGVESDEDYNGLRDIACLLGLSRSDWQDYDN